MGKGAHEPKAQTAGAYLFSLAWLAACLGVLLPSLPQDGMLAHRRVTPRQYVTGTCMYAPRPVVQKLRSALHRINHFLADNVIDFRITYPLDSDLSGGERYP